MLRTYRVVRTTERVTVLNQQSSDVYITDGVVGTTDTVNMYNRQSIAYNWQSLFLQPTE